jgi:peptidoglycan-associated lipoprotein
MYQSAKIVRAFVATLALAMAAGCTEQAPPPQQAAPAPGPELAGAWYQVYFDTNSSAINARGKLIVEKVAYVAANAGPTRVTVIGKTDRIGAPPANMALSQRRAEAVRDALIAAGVPAASIDTSWTGEAKQMVATADDAAEPRNRVVDVTVVKQSP